MVTVVRPGLAALLVLPLLVSSSGCGWALGVEERHFVPGSGGASSGSESTTGGSTVTASQTSAMSATSSSTGVVDCGDTTAADKNCGRCGHVCAVGHCVNSDCQAIQLTDSQPQAEYTHLLVDQETGGYAYWARYRPGVIYRAKKEPNAVIEPLANAADAGFIFDMTATNDELYFSNFSASDTLPSRGIYQMNKNGTGLSLMCGSGLFGPTSVKVYGNQLTFATGFDVLGIGAAQLGSATVTPIIQYLGGTEPIYQQEGNILVDPMWVYFGEAATGINRATPLGPQTIYPGEFGGAPISLRPDTRLLWLIQNDAIRIGTDDGAAEATDVVKVGYVRGWVDIGKYLYYSDDANILRVDLDHHPYVAELVVTADETVGSIAADAESLYWVEFYHGRVFQKSL